MMGETHTDGTKMAGRSMKGMCQEKWFGLACYEHLACYLWRLSVICVCFGAGVITDSWLNCVTLWLRCICETGLIVSGSDSATFSSFKLDGMKACLSFFGCN